MLILELLLLGRDHVTAISTAVDAGDAPSRPSGKCHGTPAEPAYKDLMQVLTVTVDLLKRAGAKVGCESHLCWHAHYMYECVFGLLLLRSTPSCTLTSLPSLPPLGVVSARYFVDFLTGCFCHVLLCCDVVSRCGVVWCGAIAMRQV